MRLTGVGVGPGDLELVTVKALRVLGEADRVVVPVADDAGPGYAEQVVAAHLPHVPLQRLRFSLADCAADRSADWRRAADEICAALAAGEDVAFATIGDPNVYSTFAYLAGVVTERLPDARVATVPGITAWQDLAARAGVSLVEGAETLAVLPLTAGRTRFARALADHDAVVAYKGGRRLPQLRQALADAARTDDAVYGARLGLADEHVGALPADGQGPYLSTVIVAPPGRRRGRRD